MLLKANQKVDSSLRSLRSQEDFKVFLEWLIQSRDDLIKSSVICRDEVSLRWIQGALQALEDVINRTDS